MRSDGRVRQLFSIRRIYDRFEEMSYLWIREIEIKSCSGQV
jgi:hypothetical protein